LDQHRLDPLIHTLSSVPTRRDILRGLAGVGLGALWEAEAAEARTKRRCTRKRRKKCGRSGQQCLSNGSCAIVCSDDADCLFGCGCSNPDIDGARHCIGGRLEPMPVLCTRTADCPQGSHCQDLGGGGICIALCH
jgi:hypothetical protein